MNASCLSEYGLQSSGVRRFGEPRRKPILFAEVQNCMSIAREEIFGPVLSIIPYEHENDAVRIAPLSVGRFPDFGRSQAYAGYRSEFDLATLASMAHGPTLAVVLGPTNSRATVGNGVRPSSKNSFCSRPSLGTRPREQVTLGQPSHLNFSKGPLMARAANLTSITEKHCSAICTWLIAKPCSYSNIKEHAVWWHNCSWYNVAAAMDQCNYGE
jgi:hypothetical protein